MFADAKRPVETRIVWRPHLAAGSEIAGPALIEEANSTTLIGPGDRAVVDAIGNIVVTLKEGEGQE